MTYKKSEYSFRLLLYYLKYQFVTKTLLSIFILPLYSIILTFLIRSTGRVNISSGDFLPFLFSFQGLGLLLITIILLVVFIVVDINAFIVLSSLIHEKKIFFSIRESIKIALKSIKLLFGLEGILMLFYVGLIIPILGLGITISPMKNFQIPNFIRSVIYSDKLFLSIYIAILLIFFLLALIFSFSFHYIIIAKLKWNEALYASYNLIKNNFKAFFKDFILFFGLLFAFYVLSSIVILSLFVALIEVAEFGVFMRRMLSFLIFVTSFQIFDIVSVLSAPIIIHRLTSLFYKYNQIDSCIFCENYNINIEEGKESLFSKINTFFSVNIILFCLFVFNILSSLWMAYHFDSYFNKNKKYVLVTHRAGGNLAAENSLAGLREAIKHKALYSEIDVQRTKDDKYVINHDKTFKRLCGVAKASNEMSLNEIKKLRVKNEFNTKKDPQPVATLEEMLDLAKNKIGLFIELKGKTADKKMVDDVVKMLKERKMEKNAVLLSLDYSLIRYIEDKYPEMDSGYLYFFSIGSTENMIADYFIMEEREATENNIELIKEKGKKVVVWTVNSEDSIKRFINSDVDGIITDYIEDVKSALVEKENRSDLEIIFQNFFD